MTRASESKSETVQSAAVGAFVEWFSRDRGDGHELDVDDNDVDDDDDEIAVSKSTTDRLSSNPAAAAAADTMATDIVSVIVAIVLVFVWFFLIQDQEYDKTNQSVNSISRCDTIN